MITDEEKLALLDRYEAVFWESLERGVPTGHVESYDLMNLERCQRIRANLHDSWPVLGFDTSVPDNIEFQADDYTR